MLKGGEWGRQIDDVKNGTTTELLLLQAFKKIPLIL